MNLEQFLKSVDSFSINYPNELISKNPLILNYAKALKRDAIEKPTACYFFKDKIELLESRVNQILFDLKKKESL